MKKSWIIGIIGLISYCLILKYMFHVFFPFVFAILGYFTMKPLIDYLEKNFQMQRSAIGVSLLLAVYLILAILLGIFFTYMIIFFMNFIEKIPTYYQEILIPSFNQLTLWSQNHFPFLMNQETLKFFQDFLFQSITQIVTFFSSFITHIPTYLFSFFLFIISTFFLMIDYEDIRNKFVSLFNPQLLTTFLSLKRNCLRSLWIYFKCQMILMGICFCILFFGFGILRMNHPLLYAFLTALLDSLPFIGVGIVLIPLCILYVFQKSYLRAFYIFLIYLIINVVRSFLEPHIMNKQLKIPSFLLLFSMVLHLYLFGFVGVILSPIHMSLLYGYIDNYRE